MLDHRRSMTDEFGAGTMDLALATLKCNVCQEAIPDPALRTMLVPYADLDHLLVRARTMGGSMLGEDPPTCDGCGGSAVLVHYDYHAYHAAKGCDLVIRCRDEEQPELLWWEPEQGHVPIEALSREDAAGFMFSACVRSAGMLGMVEGAVDDLAAAVEYTLGEVGADPMLLLVVPPLLGCGRAGICASVVSALLEQEPDNAQAHAWLAEITVQCINARAVPRERLPEAEAHLDRADELQPSQVQVWMTRATVRRLQGDEAAAKACYETVLELEPAKAEVLYNLAVMDLETDPEQAFERFKAGAELEPEDADYPIGCARALAACGRLDEARTWLGQGRELAPEHPRIPEVEAKLG